MTRHPEPVIRTCLFGAVTLCAFGALAQQAPQPSGQVREPTSTRAPEASGTTASSGETAGAGATVEAGVSAGTRAAAQGAATIDESAEAAAAVVARLQRALIEAAGYPDVAARYGLLEAEIAATHDLAYIGELALRRQWRELDEAQRSAFIDRFSALSIMTYAARFDAVGEGSFRIDGTEPAGDGRMQVASSIARADGSRVPLDYVLQDGAQGWRIVNVVADGVSDLALKRAEYRALFEERGFDGLLAELDRQTAELEATAVSAAAAAAETR